MSEKLLDCPFCGSADLIDRDFHDEDGGYYEIGCKICSGAREVFCGVHAEDRAEAVRQWNTRAPQSPAPAPSALQPEWQPIKNAPRDRRIEVRYLTDDPRPVQWMATDHGVGWHLANGFGAVPIEFDPTEWRDMVARAAATTVEPSDWQDDPSADDRWNAGLDFGQQQLCKYLGVDPDDVTWDAATEELEGDVQAVIGNILRAKFGEDWGPSDGAIYAAVSRTGTTDTEHANLMRDVDVKLGDLAIPSTAMTANPRVDAAWLTAEHAEFDNIFATPPSSGNADAVRVALERAENSFDKIRLTLINHLEEPERTAFWEAVNAREYVRAALSSAPVAGEWQDISTAPKDGNAIMVCDDRTLDGCHQVVFWNDDHANEWKWDTSDGPSFHADAFTHWKPLDPPPHTRNERVTSQPDTNGGRP